MTARYTLCYFSATALKLPALSEKIRRYTYLEMEGEIEEWSDTDGKEN